MNLRLLVTEECNRTCEGCCNKDWDLDKLSVASEEDIDTAEKVMITGGEPMIDTFKLIQVLNYIFNIRRSPEGVILYTAYPKVERYYTKMILSYLGGLTITLHESKDLDKFFSFMSSCQEYMNDKSLRLNVFKGIEITKQYRMELGYKFWNLKEDMEWIEDCPLPENEEFKRIDGSLIY